MVFGDRMIVSGLVYKIILDLVAVVMLLTYGTNKFYLFLGVNFAFKIFIDCLAISRITTIDTKNFFKFFKKRKRKITLDFDGTIYSTASRMVDGVKEDYPECYIGGEYEDIKEFGFKPVLNIEDHLINSIFASKDFYIEEYLMDGAVEAIKKYQDLGIIVEILSVGSPLNNYNKAKLLKEVGLDLNLILITSIGGKKVSFDKGTYTSAVGIFGKSIYIDDRLECLDTVHAKKKIQMRENGYVLESDDSNKYKVVTNWEDAEKLIDNYFKIK